MQSDLKDLVENHYQVVEIITDKLLKNPGYREYRRFREDLIGVGSIALVRCAERFDHNRGVKFVTYCSRIIKGAIRNYIENKLYHQRHIECDIDSIDLDRYTTEEQDEQEGEEEYVEGLVDMFAPKTQIQKEAYYRLILGCESIGEVAKDLGVSIGTMRQIKGRLVKKLRSLKDTVKREDLIIKEKHNG